MRERKSWVCGDCCAFRTVVTALTNSGVDASATGALGRIARQSVIDPEQAAKTLTAAAKVKASEVAGTDWSWQLVDV